MSFYNGSVSKWGRFIAAWARTEVPGNFSWDESKYRKMLAKGLPKSFVDFYFAMDAFDWPALLKVDFEDDESIVVFSDIVNLVLDQVPAAVPEEFLDENYRVYDASQEEVSPYLPGKLFEMMVSVADYEDGVYDAKISV